MSRRGRHPQNKLRDLIARQAGPGRHADGNGLYMYVRPNGARSWVQRITIHRSRCDIGLGPYPLVPLIDARQRALENRRIVHAGGDPRHRAKAALENPPTVREIYEEVTENRRLGWKSAGTAATWRRDFEKRIFPIIGSKPVATVTVEDVRRIVLPHWQGRNSKGPVLRQNLEALFDWAVLKKYRPDNPAALIKRFLPRVRDVGNHRPSLPYSEAPEALAELQALPVDPAVTLVILFIVLTAARLCEATGATWPEIDLTERVWQVPKERMKADRAHTVPLSLQAVEVIERARALKRDESLVFSRRGRDGKRREVSQGVVSAALRKLGRVSAKGRPIVAHGFRATFRVWAIEVARARREICEPALAHGESDATVGAYTDDADPFADRTELMQQWADYVLPRSRGRE